MRLFPVGNRREKLFLDHLIFEGDALRIVRFEPARDSCGIGERLDVIGMADVITVIDYIQTVIGFSSVCGVP